MVSKQTLCLVLACLVSLSISVAAWAAPHFFGPGVDPTWLVDWSLSWEEAFSRVVDGWNDVLVYTFTSWIGAGAVLLLLSVAVCWHWLLNRRLVELKYEDS